MLFFGGYVEQHAGEIAAGLDLRHRAVPARDPAIGDRELLPFDDLRADGSGAQAI